MAEGGRQSGESRPQFSLELCSEPKIPLIKPLQSYPSLWRSVFLLLQFSKLYWHVQLQDLVHTHPRSREPGPPSSHGRNRRRKPSCTTCETRCVVLGVSAQMGGGGRKRVPHSAQPVTGSWAPGPPPSPSPSEANEGIPIMQSLMQIAIGGGGRHACGTQSSHSEP